MDLMIDWHDFVRVIAFGVNLFVLHKLLLGYRKRREGWNEKTLDLWFALVMWSFAGLVFCLQGIFLDRPFTPGFVFLTAATLVGGRALHRSGSWGDERAA